ncbi:MAG: DUF1501 domain-containing protein [Paludibacter sp.]
MKINKRYILFILVLLLTNISDAQQAKSVILIYLEGGPAQTDTFDPKPESSRDYFGLLKGFSQTNIPTIQLGEKLPLLAAQADKFSIIRSMTHGVFAHETAHYAMITGDQTKGAFVYPSFGSVIAYKLKDSYKGILPPYISVVNANTRFNEGGFIGNQFKSFDTNGQPEKGIFEVDGIVNNLVNPEKFMLRNELLKSFENVNAVSENAIQKNLASLRAKDIELIGGEVRKVFDLSTETTTIREKYGMSRIGQSCLVARKLVQAGVPFISVRTTGWDTHKAHFQRMNEMLPDLDKALSTLLVDLSEKGLLENTIVLCGGEFGRTPKVLWEAPWNGGRAHFGTAFSYLVAGGGFKSSQVIGKTDKTGENILERKVFPCDLIATVYKLMGIDPYGTLQHPTEGALPMLPSLGKNGQSNGILLELIK